MAHDLLRALGIDADDPAVAAQLEQAEAEYEARWLGPWTVPAPRWMHPLTRLWLLVASLCCPRHALGCGPLHHPGGHHSYPLPPRLTPEERFAAYLDRRIAAAFRRRLLTETAPGHEHPGTLMHAAAEARRMEQARWATETGRLTVGQVRHTES